MNDVSRYVEFRAVPLIFEDSPPKRFLVRVDDIVSVKEHTEDSCKISTRDGDTVSVYGSYTKIIDAIRKAYTNETKSVQPMIDLIEHIQMMLTTIYDTGGYIQSRDMECLMQTSDRLKELVKEGMYVVSKEDKDG